MSLENKKIAFFVALSHHTRFLLPIVEGVKRRGADVLIFTTATDYPFELDLIRKGYEFRYFIEYADPETRKKIRDATRLFVDEWAEICFGWEGFRRWSLFEQHRSFIRNIEEYFCLEQMIKRENIDMFVSLHEMTAWGKLIGHLSSKHGIPYITLQEGDYYTDILGYSVHTEYSTADLLWGEATAEILARAKSAPEKMVIVGNTHIDEAVKRYSSASMRKKIRKELGISTKKGVLSFLIDFDWGTLRSREIWKSLLEGVSTLGLQPVFKWHPTVHFKSYKEIEIMIKEILPDAIMLLTYDPYKVLTVSDYCVIFGKTTLGIEALAFGKPLFAVPSLHEGEEYFVNLGVAQPISPGGGWECLLETVKNGVPENIKENSRRLLRRSFHKLDGGSVERTLNVLEHILDSRMPGTRAIDFRHNAIPGRMSFIIPAGSDAEALLASLTSLSQNVGHPDWEVVIVDNNGEMEGLLSGISGDVTVVEAGGDSLSMLYNRGAEAASGEVIIFMKPGVVYYRGDALVDSVKGGIAGIPLRNPDMTPYCLGIGFDFNHVPYRIVDGNADGDNVTIHAVGGGFIGIDRAVLSAVGGFDEEIADPLIEADICLSARERNLPVRYITECLGFVFRETFACCTDTSSLSVGEDWRGRVRFFAKWCGKLPKDDDYITFAGDLLKI